MNSCQSSPERKATKEECERFRKGSFIQTWQEDTTQYKIERNDSIQTEYLGNKGGYIKMKIKWLSACNYELTFLSQHTIDTDSVVNPAEIRKLDVKILKTRNDSCDIIGSNGIDQMRGVICVAK